MTTRTLTKEQLSAILRYAMDANGCLGVRCQVCPLDTGLNEENGGTCVQPLISERPIPKVLDVGRTCREYVRVHTEQFDPLELMNYVL